MLFSNFFQNIPISMISGTNVLSQNLSKRSNGPFEVEFQRGGTLFLKEFLVDAALGYGYCRAAGLRQGQRVVVHHGVGTVLPLQLRELLEHLLVAMAAGRQEQQQRQYGSKGTLHIFR